VRPDLEHVDFEHEPEAESCPEPGSSATPLRPWDRLPGEGDHRWAAFKHYRNTPPERRSYWTTARSLQLDPTHVEQYARLDFWHERAAAYDLAVDRAEQRGTLANAEARGRELANARGYLTEFAVDSARKLRDQAGKLQSFGSGEPAHHAREGRSLGMLVQSLQHAESQAAGIPTAPPAVVKIDFSGLTAEQMEAVRIARDALGKVT
jgi:hypothetical protein